MAFEKADKKTEIETLMAQVGSPILTINEARQILNMPNIEGGDELKKLAPPPEEKPDEEPEEDPEDEDKGKELTRSILKRLVKRLSKDDRAGRPDFIERHRSTIFESLGAFKNAQHFTDTWLETLNDELREVLPEQRKDVFQRIDIDKLVGQLWNEDTAI